MTDDTIVQFRQPGSFSDDPLTEVLRVGARQLLGQAIEAEVEAHIAAHEHLRDRAGHRRIVRHGQPRLPGRHQVGLRCRGCSNDGLKYRFSRVRRYIGVSRMDGRYRTESSFRVLATHAT